MSKVRNLTILVSLLNLLAINGGNLNYLDESCTSSCLPPPISYSKMPTELVKQSGRYRFGKRSKANLARCHSDLILILTEALRVSRVDFTIVEGHRTVEVQQDYFSKGVTKLDGLTKLSKHNYFPSKAVDLYPFYNGKVHIDVKHLVYLAAVIQTVSLYLYESGQTNHVVRWGGNWNSNGIILYDQSFDDLPHFELVKISN